MRSDVDFGTNFRPSDREWGAGRLMTRRPRSLSPPRPEVGRAVSPTRASTSNAATSLLWAPDVARTFYDRGGATSAPPHAIT